jgi:hypothetical protein
MSRECVFEKIKIYAVNLVVDTKNTDIYDKVALNKYPIIIRCKNEAQLKELLASEEIMGFVQKVIKSQRVFDSAEWMIRSIYSDKTLEIIWKLSETIDISYLRF